MSPGRQSVCLAFSSPSLPRTKDVERQVRAYRGLARNHYPNLMPEILGRLLVLERGIILTEEDMAQILASRDERMRKQGETNARKRQLQDLDIPTLMGLILRRLGL